MARNVSATERRLAQMLLARLGVRTNDIDAIAAIVAWMRASSGGRIDKARGNNIFGVRLSPLVSRLAIGSYLDGGQRLAKFASYADAVRAVTRVLLKGNVFGTGAFLRALRRGMPTDRDDRARRVNDILLALTLSNMDVHHFNMRAGPYSGVTSDLWQAFAGIGTITLPPPPQPKQPKPKPPKRKPLPKIPRDLRPPGRPVDYIDGFAARGFYLATRPKYPDGI